MVTKERLEMAIPMWSSDFIAFITIDTIAVIATAVAVLELLFQVAIITPCIWLAFIAWRIWCNCKFEGGLRRWLVTFLGVIAHKQLVEAIPQATGSVEIRFGYRLLGRPLLYFKVPLDRIETVKWSHGQARSSWNVCIWFDHPEKGPPNKNCVRPEDMGVYCVGPSRGKEKTEALGLAFVDFLSRAGATMVRGKDDCTFVRATPGTTQDEERPM